MINIVDPKNWEVAHCNHISLISRGELGGVSGSGTTLSLRQSGMNWISTDDGLGGRSHSELVSFFCKSGMNLISTESGLGGTSASGVACSELMGKIPRFSTETLKGYLRKSAAELGSTTCRKQHTPGLMRGQDA